MFKINVLMSLSRLARGAGVEMIIWLVFPDPVGVASRKRRVSRNYEVSVVTFPAYEGRVSQEARE